MTRPTPVLSLEGVSKSYGRIEALRDVSFSIQAGEFVGLLGPNGAGKSTMFQIISGLFSPDGGTVEVFGRRHGRDSAAILRRLGVVFQVRSVDMDMTIRANLTLHGRLFGLSGRVLRDRIDELTDRFGLADLVARPVRHLSGGQQRKVEIARALMNRPGLLIMDEPTAGLDSPSRRTLVQDMRALATEAEVAILWATHLVDEIEHADRVIFLKAGQIVADGTPGAMLEQAGSGNLTDAYAVLLGAGEDDAAR
ncbi:ABC transporter ATP-binding protein [Mesobacterium pallidum]|uniref:ABC transporter ATP-binding protein n=1 Tax=Mesobacterium pallidum TaxID=2872037 RepID=UPI001EE27E1D|nr:ATP-binding cassette domain-containing protein [Mesobacterium pallidum]